MKLSVLADQIGAKIAAHSPRANDVEIETVCAGDHMSDLLRQATDVTLVVTNLAHAMLPRMAELMDAPAVCLLNGVAPQPEVLDAAAAHNTVLLVSPVGMYQTCGRLYQVLGERTAPKQ